VKIFQTVLPTVVEALYCLPPLGIMDSPEVNTNSALMLRTVLTESGFHPAEEASSVTNKWLQRAQRQQPSSAAKEDVDMKKKIRSDVLSNLRSLQTELDATAWMYSSNYKES
jgi:multidrug resistance efflux pump